MVLITLQFYWLYIFIFFNQDNVFLIMKCFLDEEVAQLSLSKVICLVFICDQLKMQQKISRPIKFRKEKLNLLEHYNGYFF